jgi:integrase
MQRTKNNPGIYKRITKTGEVRYVVVTGNGRGGQHKSTHRTLAEAREAKKNAHRDNREPAARERFEVYAEEWLSVYNGRSGKGIDPATIRAYRKALEDHVYPRLGRLRMSEIETRHLKLFIGKLQQTKIKSGQGKGRTLKPNTIRGVFAPVRACLADAADDGVIPSNPASGIRINDHRQSDERLADDEKVKALTSDELGLLLSEIPATKINDASALTWRDFFTLLAQTGLRISEALGLEWQDVELGERPVLHVRRQFRDNEIKTLKTTNSRRDLPLSPTLARCLWSARPSSGHGVIFTNREGKHHSRHNIAHRVLRPAAKRAGVSWIGFHTLRHTNASLLFSAGKNAKQVQKRLGHATSAFTLDTYIHLLDDGFDDSDFADDLIKPVSPASDATRGDADAPTAIDPPAADAA